MCEQARPSVSLPFSFASHRAVPGTCADHVVYEHRPSHVDRRVCRGNAAAAGGQCPLPVPMKLCAGIVRPTWTGLNTDDNAVAPRMRCSCPTAALPPPQAQPHNRAAGRWRSHRVREADKKKRGKTAGSSLLVSTGFALFFVWPAATFTQTKSCLSGGF